MGYKIENHQRQIGLPFLGDTPSAATGCSYVQAGAGFLHESDRKSICLVFLKMFQPNALLLTRCILIPEFGRNQMTILSVVLISFIQIVLGVGII